MNIWSNNTLVLVNRSLRIVFMIIECKEFYPHVIQDIHVILSSVEKQLRVFDENIPGFFSI